LIGFFLVAALGGCLEKDKETANLSPEAKVHMDRLNNWRLGDWLHDIDSAAATLAAAKRGDLGQTTPELVMKVEPVNRALKLASVGGSFSGSAPCWPQNKLGDPIEATVNTAHTDHACLDAKGFKRSK
jgi:hypothetical protein